MSEPTKPSFLGIPRELRLQIYGCLLDADVNWEMTPSLPIPTWRGKKPASDAEQDEEISGLSARIAVPWVSLMRSCKTVVAEMHSLLFASQLPEHSCTYTMAMEMDSNHISSVRWSRLPCPPSLVQKLEVDFHPSGDFQTWGCGGPRPILQQLYQALNFFLHCGPSFDRRRRLDTHIRLQELVLRSHDEKMTNRSSDRTLFLTYAADLGHAQYLREYVQQIRVIGAETETVTDETVTVERAETVTVVSKGGMPVVPDDWVTYGFDWGPHVVASGNVDRSS